MNVLKPIFAVAILALMSFAWMAVPSESASEAELSGLFAVAANQTQGGSTTTPQTPAPQYIHSRDTYLAYEDLARGSVISLHRLSEGQYMLLITASIPSLEERRDFGALSTPRRLERVELSATVFGVTVPIGLSQVGNVWTTMLDLRPIQPGDQISLTFDLWYDGSDVTGAPTDSTTFDVGA